MVLESKNVKVTNWDNEIYVARSTIVHNLLLCAQTLRTNYQTETLLFVSSPVKSRNYGVFYRSKGEKHATKNVVGLHSHSPLLIVYSKPFFGCHATFSADWPRNTRSITPISFSVDPTKTLYKARFLTVFFLSRYCSINAAKTLRMCQQKVYLNRFKRLQTFFFFNPSCEIDGY